MESVGRTRRVLRSSSSSSSRMTTIEIESPDGRTDGMPKRGKKPKRTPSPPPDRDMELARIFLLIHKWDTSLRCRPALDSISVGGGGRQLSFCLIWIAVSALLLGLWIRVRIRLDHSSTAARAVASGPQGRRAPLHINTLRGISYMSNLRSHVAKLGTPRCPSNRRTSERARRQQYLNHDELPLGCP